MRSLQRTSKAWSAQPTSRPSGQGGSSALLGFCFRRHGKQLARFGPLRVLKLHGAMRVMIRFEKTLQVVSSASRLRHGTQITLEVSLGVGGIRDSKVWAWNDLRPICTGKSLSVVSNSGRNTVIYGNICAAVTTPCSICHHCHHIDLGALITSLLDNFIY